MPLRIYGLQENKARAPLAEQPRLLQQGPGGSRPAQSFVRPSGRARSRDGFSAQPIPSGLLHRDRDLCARRGCLPFILTYVVLAWLCALCVQFFLLLGQGGTRRIAFLPFTWCVVYSCLRLGVQRAPRCSSVPTAGDAQGAGRAAPLMCCRCCSRGGRAGTGAGSLVSFTFGLRPSAAPVPGGALAEDDGA